jgi:UDP-glucuronate 4-epimerase
MTMTYLITGAAGFIGHALAGQLMARGDNVFGIDNLNDYYDPALKTARLNDLRHRYGNLFSFANVDFADHLALDVATAGVEIFGIAHLGAQAGVRYSIENPRAYVQSNLVGHVNMLELARVRGIKNMVYASSSSVYGGNDKTPFSVEDRADHPVSLYAATKRADELISESYAHLYRIPLTGLRFFTVYGPWGRPDMAPWMFTRDILAGKTIKVFNNGDMRRDFTYIDDIVAGVIACLDTPAADDGVIKAGGSKAPHRIYNIGNNQSVELMKFINAIEDACGKKAQIDFHPMQAGDVYETHANIDAIATDLGYAPRTTIADGIPKFVQWYRQFYAV